MKAPVSYSRLAYLKAFLLMSLALVILPACTTNPATGDTDFVLMSESDELRLGKSYHQQILQSYGRYDNEALQRYVDKVGQRLVRVSHRPNLTYHFTVVDSDEVNAFALPGGYIYVTRGMLAYLKNEAELAAVLGHELGHVTARHAVRKQSASTAVGVAGAVLAAATGISGAGQLSNLAGTALVQGYGRDLELEADGFGAEYIVRSGYNPDAMKQVVLVLKDQERYERDQAKKENRDPNIYHGLFSSHPENDKRLAEILKHAKSLSVKSGTLPDNEVVYLAAISGMVYGGNPEQGIFRDNVFYHPSLGFAITMPDGWQLENAPDELTAISHDRSAEFHLVLGENRTGLSGERYLKEALPINRLVDSQPLVGRGKTGVTARTLLETGSATLPARVSYAELNGQVFLMVGVAADKDALTRFDRDFVRTSESLRRLSVNEQRITPLRVVMYRVRAGDTWDSLAARSPIPNDAESRLRLMNDQYPVGELQAGQVVKIVE